MPDVFEHPYDEYVRQLEAAGLGCRSSSCTWWHKGGMVTNGPCRCNTGHVQRDTDVQDLISKLRQAAYAGARLAKAIKPKLNTATTRRK